MTAPTPDQQPGGSRPRLRVGQTVTFRHPDPSTGGVVEGHGLVLRVPNDPDAAVTVAPLSLLHLFVEPDNIAVAKAEGVPVLNEPAPADEAPAAG